MGKLTKTAIASAMPREKQYTIWCGELKGFGVSINPAGSRTFIVDYKNVNGKRRRMSIGRFGAISVDKARSVAITRLADAIQGEDPLDEREMARRSMTVGDLCALYLETAEKGLILGKRGRPKKASTLYIDKGRVAQHILPLLGGKVLSEITTADINRFIRDVSSGKTAKSKASGKPRGKTLVTGGLGTATRTAGLLGGIFSFAISEGIIDSNPVSGSQKPSYNIRHRRLNKAEFASLGRVLRTLEANGAASQLINIALVIAMTGCRRGEIIRLRWSEIDFDSHCFRLGDSKEGYSVRPIGKPVLDILAKLDSGDGYVFPGIRRDGHYGAFPKGWKKIAELANLKDVTPHTLRHSFASVAAEIGMSEPTIASLLGHSGNSVTRGYIHQLDEILVSAADKVSLEIAAQMGVQV